MSLRRAATVAALWAGLSILALSALVVWAAAALSRMNLNAAVSESVRRNNLDREERTRAILERIDRMESRLAPRSDLLGGVREAYIR